MHPNIRTAVVGLQEALVLDGENQITTPVFLGSSFCEAAARRSTKGSVLVEGADDWALAAAGPRRGSRSSGAGALATAAAAAVLTAAAGPRPCRRCCPGTLCGWRRRLNGTSNTNQIPRLRRRPAARSSCAARAPPSRPCGNLLLAESSRLLPHWNRRGAPPSFPPVLVLDVQLQLVDRYVRRDGLDARRRWRVLLLRRLLNGLHELLLPQPLLVALVAHELPLVR